MEQIVQDHNKGLHNGLEFEFKDFCPICSEYIKKHKKYLEFNVDINFSCKK